MSARSAISIQLREAQYVNNLVRHIYIAHPFNVQPSQAILFTGTCSRLHVLIRLIIGLRASTVLLVGHTYLKCSPLSSELHNEHCSKNKDAKYPDTWALLWQKHWIRTKVSRMLTCTLEPRLKYTLPRPKTNNSTNTTIRNTNIMSKESITIADFPGNETSHLTQPVEIRPGWTATDLDTNHTNHDKDWHIRYVDQAITQVTIPNRIILISIYEQVR